MSTHDRSRRRFAGHRGNPPPPPSQAPQPPTQRVMPRGGNGVPTRRRIEQVLERSTIPVESAEPPTSRLLGTDASAAALQEGFSEVCARLGAIEDGLVGLVHALRVQFGLAEADDELEQLRQQNLELREQCDSAHRQLDQIRASVGLSAFSDAPRPTAEATEPAPAPAAEQTPTPPAED